MAIAIKNLRSGFPGGKADVRVDRASIFGNPYRLYGESNRAGVCEKYEVYFRQKLAKCPSFKAEVDKLIDLYKQHNALNLYCWCAPKQCHAETIRDYILQAVIEA